MKKQFGPMAASSMAVLMGLCAILLYGCEIIPSYESAWGADDAGAQVTPMLPADTGTPVYDTSPQYNGNFVSGSKSTDGGKEIYGYVGGMDIRVLANDSDKIPGAVGGYYFISGSLINETGALIVNGNTITASDFTSSRSGKKYAWMGWTIGKSSAPLTTQNPLTLGGLSGTLRSYWVTVQ